MHFLSLYYICLSLPGLEIMKLLPFLRGWTWGRGYGDKGGGIGGGGGGIGGGGGGKRG